MVVAAAAGTDQPAATAPKIKTASHTKFRTRPCDLPRVSHVVYAVDVVVVLRCTRQLLPRLKRLEAADTRSTTRLGDWY
jgi:hypothetical protein